MSYMNRAITVAAIPDGWPKASDFHLIEEALRPLAPGEVLIGVRYLSMDPWTRFQLDQVGRVVMSETVGEVLESRHPGFDPGDAVWGMTGWQSHAIMEGSRLRKVETYGHPLSTALGVLGFTGLTAYFALLDKSNPQPGETVVVTGAAGAVGSIAAQIAKIKGCKVIGTAGSDEKAAFLTESLGLDHALNYKQVDDYAAAFRALAPNGVDILLDGVGGPIQDGVVAALNPGARVVTIGSISRYNVAAGQPRPPRLLDRFQGQVFDFSAGDYFQRLGESQQDLIRWMAEGRITYRETITEGIENAPAAFLGMMRGQNTGKALVRV